jgi:glycosyltransferase involved in cell wall biosynthesis
VAVAPGDPFDPATFSGYSAHLFSEIAQRGVDTVPIRSRNLRWFDALTGAVTLRSLLHGRAGDRSCTRLNPNWYWSQTGFRRACRRFDQQLAELQGPIDVLQIGTQVLTRRPDTRLFCLTDCTIVQGIDLGGYSVCRTSPRVASEAIRAQGEVFEAAAKIFTLSQWAADSIVNDYGLPPDRVIVVGAGANLEPTPRRPTGEHDPHPYILFVGYAWEQKGGPLLVEAFRLLRDEFPAARLKVVGCSPVVSDDRVDVVGRLRSDDELDRRRLADLYAGASCLAILSAADAFPNVVLEAGLLGVPVVALDSGSRREAVIDGETGLLVPDAQPHAVAAVLRTLLSDPSLVEQMGAAGRAFVESKFTWPTVATRVLTAMNEAP